MSLSDRVMSAGLLLAGIGLAQTCLALTPEDQLGIETQCRAEAETYGIPPEQQAEYIDGCILSMGGYVTDPPQAETTDFSAPAEGGPYDDTFAVEPAEPDAVPEYTGETP